MLYVFHVDMGRMMTFDMTVALSSVENLKDTIERLHGIPAANIVLLVSGGEMLTKSAQVSGYSAGTDTNPIYMFLTGDMKFPTNAAISDADVDLREQVDRCLELPAVYDTVAKRAQLALKMYDLARDEEKLCERLVHEQHLQQQGWSAVVANMEDLTDEVRQRFKYFCTAFDRHLENRGNYLELLRHFGDDLTKLSRIPILPALMSLAEEDFHGFDEFLDVDEVFARSQQEQISVIAVEPSGIKTDDNSCNISDTEKVISSTSPHKKLKMGNEHTEERTAAVTCETSTTSGNQRRTFTLLQWISAKENHDTLKLMSEECVQGLGTFNEDVYEKLKAEVRNIIKLADHSEVKDIKGLGERLCRLEEFKYKIKSMVQDQKELSTAFQQNQNRAINLRDASILPDLCASHQSQLLVMLKNHQKIREHKLCIIKAKDELGLNLHTRLKRIVWIENAMSELDNRLLFYRHCLLRAERHINIIEQIHQAPSIYVAAVTEVVRRKIFSDEFRKWASKLANDFDAIHNEEIKRRQMFNARFEGHFLNILFPGMNDMPPAFANENPLVFDARLPNITRSDIDMLSSHLPDLSYHVQLPDMTPVINFFVSRSGEHQKERLEELLLQKLAAAEVVNTKQPSHPQLEEQKVAGVEVAGDELEIDTEDFEKVKQSEVSPTTETPIDVATSTSEYDKESIARSTITDCLTTFNVETLTEENESSMRAEVERLRGLLDAMSKLSIECLSVARGNLETFRKDSTGYQKSLLMELQKLSDNWNMLQIRKIAKEREQEEELYNLRKVLEEKNAELSALREQLSEKKELELRNSLLEKRSEEIQERLKYFETEKENAVAEAREKLIHEHKTEIESLRCRFKLMASTEFSPSKASLEKPSQLNEDMIDIACHEMICAQIRSELNATKEKEITAALEAERSIWQSKIFPMNSESVMANVNLLKDMLEEKEKQLDMLREKDLMLTKENYQLKTRLDSLTNDDGNSWLREKIEYLNKDKCRLQEELTVEISRRLEMECSIAELSNSMYEKACVVGSLPRSKWNNYGQKHIVLESCSTGDIVFVIWSVRHGQFMVVQDSQSLYFVHADSLPALNLHFPVSPADGTFDHQIPVPYYEIGRVIDKEYCQAKKDENRYRVTKGTKFYRIKLAPLPTKQSIRKERAKYFSPIRSISQSDSHGEIPPNHASSSNPRTTSSTGCVTLDSTAAVTGRRCSKDVTDFSANSPFKSKSSAKIEVSFVTERTSRASFNERTVSITSTGEEEPASVSPLTDYFSIGEEDKLLTIATSANQSLSLQQKQSVITEQPTASSSTANLKLDLMLASADLPHSTQTTTSSKNVMAPESPTTFTATNADGTSIAALPTAGCPSPSIPTPVGTSEDSDEYRSLEAKDDSELLPLSE